MKEVLGAFIPGALIAGTKVVMENSDVCFTCTDETLYDEDGNEVITYSFEDLNTFTVAE